MNNEYSQMTAENVPKSVRITLISQLIFISIALLLESSLFFTTIYETFAPQVCVMKFNGKEICTDYSGQETNISPNNSFLKLLWPISMTELLLLLSVLALKLVYIITYRWATLIKILSLSLLGLLICLEILLLIEYENMQYIYPFDYEIKLYPVIAKLTIGILVILIGVAMWIEDVKTFRFKVMQSCASSQQHQLLSMQ